MLSPLLAELSPLLTKLSLLDHVSGHAGDSLPSSHRSSSDSSSSSLYSR
jgi:hypothetical protein